MGLGELIRADPTRGHGRGLSVDGGGRRRTAAVQRRKLTGRVNEALDVVT